MTARCRACAALIEWCVTAKGNRIPMDVEPVKSVFRIVRSGSGDPRIEAADVYRSHFATCSVPENFRKARRTGHKVASFAEKSAPDE